MDNSNEIIETKDLIQEIQLALKDVLVARVHRKGVELDLEFPNGQNFTLTLFENARKNFR